MPSKKPKLTATDYINRLRSLLDQAEATCQEGLTCVAPHSIEANQLVISSSHLLWATEILADKTGQREGGEPDPGTEPLPLVTITTYGVCLDAHEPYCIARKGKRCLMGCKQCDVRALVPTNQDPRQAKWITPGAEGWDELARRLALGEE